MKYFLLEIDEALNAFNFLTCKQKYGHDKILWYGSLDYILKYYELGVIYYK